MVAILLRGTFVSAGIGMSRLDLLNRRGALVSIAIFNNFISAIFLLLIYIYGVFFK